MLKPDFWIRKMCLEQQMITPFSERSQEPGHVSYGLSSYGYDIRLADEYKIFVGAPGAVLDPKTFDHGLFKEHTGPQCVVPPHSFVLTKSLEHFDMPRNVLALCQGKSTWARCGLIVNVTPLEPGWKGHLTMAISNTAPAPVRLHSGEGIAQLVFLESPEPCETSYADRKGRYQGQTGIAGPRLKDKE